MSHQAAGYHHSNQNQSYPERRKQAQWIRAGWENKYNIPIIPYVQKYASASSNEDCGMSVLVLLHKVEVQHKDKTVEK